MTLRTLNRLLWGVRVALVGVVVAASLWLSGCGNSVADRWLGAVETTQQRVYRAAGAYGVIGGLACEYVQTPTALSGASARLAQAGDAAYEALVEARAYGAFGDPAAGLAALSGLMTGLATQVLEVTVDASEVAGGGAAGMAAYAVDRALQVAVGYAHLRAALAGLKGDLALMVAEGRDPTSPEWDDVMAAAEAARDCLVGAAGG
ncbi:hypothetical protein [uncultured Rhodospira sp.]|uniref:hypothetical protein n=1 Tax=uncultured Rhodospira sp. TaxID=1936189 RepID=UPI0026212B42|nr:hypothetical protein [uncultured Rhodospira sp.]